MTVELLFDQVRARTTEPQSLADPIEVNALATPALVLNRANFEANLKKMADHVDAFGKGFRPHAKTHKCPAISKEQLALGAVGVCVAKLSEAVVLTGAGVGPILITSPITRPDKIGILNKLLNEGHELALVLDSQKGLELLEAQVEGDNVLGLVVDLDVAMGRTGTRDDDLVRRLVEKIDSDPRFQFLGFQHYAGHVMHIHGHAERANASLELWQAIVDRINRMDVPYSMLTGCGTGTFDIDVNVAEITDLQVGSYIFMDEEYRQIGGHSGDRFEDFDVSLTVACTAISQPMDGAITVDGGYKALASDTVPPAVDELVNTKYRFAGDEHGVLISRESIQSVQLGDVVQVVSPHCDPTINLHDFLWIQDDDGLIRECWPIAARGCTW